MNQRVVITHAVLAGLTPLIPIPGLDDLVKSFFVQSLIRSVASGRGVPLSGAEVTALAEEQSGCMRGCVIGIVEYTVKSLIRKLTVVLEWRRSIELVTHTYYFGHLLDYAFQQGWYVPGDAQQAARLRVAIEQAYRTANTEVVKRAVRSSFNRSSKLVLSAVRQVTDSLQDIAFRRSRLWLRRRVPGAARRVGRRSKPTTTEDPQMSRAEAAVADKLEQESPRVRTTLNDLITQLHGALTGLPDGHFDLLHDRLEQALRQSEA